MNLEIHDLIKTSLLTILARGLEEDNIEELVDQANSIFPKFYHLYGAILNEYPDLLPNLECLLEKAERQDIDLYMVLELRKNLLRSYLYLLDYKRVKPQLDWFAKNKKDIVTLSADSKQLGPAVIFLAHAAAYQHFIEDKTEEALSTFEEAIRLIKDKDIRELKGHTYERYAQVLLCSGYIDSAWEKIKVVQEEMANNPDAIVDKGLLYYTLAVMFLERGEYDAALEYMNKSIDERREVGRVPANEFGYVGKAEVLLRAGKYQEALEVAGASYKRADDYFDKDHDLKNRLLIFLAWAEIGCGKAKEATKTIASAKAFFSRAKGDGERKGGKYLAYISIVEGEIAMHKKDYAVAVEKYIEAREHLGKTRINLKNDFYGFILEKLAMATVLAQQNANKAHYLTECEKIFGKTNDRAIRMRSLS